MPEIDCKESSNIHWARWNNETQVLEIDFKNAAGVKVSTYEYRGFTGEDYDRLKASESKGRHFAYDPAALCEGRRALRPVRRRFNR
jgi:hypothetical protein